MRKVAGWLLVLPFLGALFIAWLIFIRMGEGGVGPWELQELRLQMAAALAGAVVLLGIVIALLRGGKREPHYLPAGAFTRGEGSEPKAIAASKPARRKSRKPRRKSEVKKAKEIPVSSAAHPRREIIHSFLEWRRARNVAKQETLAESEARAERHHAEWILRHPEYAFHLKAPDTSRNRAMSRSLARSGVVSAIQAKPIGQSNLTKTRNFVMQTVWRQPVGLAHNRAPPSYGADLLRRQSHLGASVELARLGRNRTRTATKATFNVATSRAVKVTGGHHSISSQPNHLTGSGAGSGLRHLAATLEATSSLLTDDCLKTARWLDTHPANSALWRVRSLAYFDVCVR